MITKKDLERRKQQGYKSTDSNISELLESLGINDISDININGLCSGVDVSAYPNTACMADITASVSSIPLCKSPQTEVVGASQVISPLDSIQSIETKMELDMMTKHRIAMDIAEGLLSRGLIDFHHIAQSDGSTRIYGDVTVQVP